MKTRDYYCILCVLFIWLVGCDKDDLSPDEPTNYTCPKVNPQGKLHMEVCEKNEECLYGLCYASPNVSQNQFKFCTKNCSAGDATCMCSADGEQYTCIRLGPKYGEKYSGFCGLICNSDEVCQAIDPRYRCSTDSTGSAKRYCRVE